MNDKVMIQESSAKSLFIKMYYDDIELAVGTGFIVEKEGRHILITAKHNFTGRHHNTNKCIDEKTAAIPNKIKIMHHTEKLGQWHEVEYFLYDNSKNLEQPRWQEHKLADVAALIINCPLIKIYPYDIYCIREILISPSEQVCVIGFPFGLAQGGYFGIWTTGFMASEPDIDYDNLPCFLIDCRTREGQSGSPVVASRNAGYKTISGDVNVGASKTELIGIYTGRVNKESDIGYVWKLKAIQELVEQYKFEK